MSRDERRWAKKQERFHARIAENHGSGLYYKSHRFVPTPDEWSPCYFFPYQRDDGTWTVDYDAGAPMVKGTVYLLPDGETWFVRISFWGRDDTGIERDYYFVSIEDAREQYHRLVTWLNNLAIVCKNDLLKLGYVHA